MYKRDWTVFVHEYIGGDGKIHYAVAEWDWKKGQYIVPLDAEACKMTGCSAEFAKTAKGIGGGTDRRAALRRARYLFGGQ